MIRGLINGIFNWGMFTGIILTLIVVFVLGMIIFISRDNKGDKDSGESK